MTSIALQSDQLNEVATALIEAQKEMKPVEKDASNPFFKSKYATLTACIEGTRDVLTKNGLCITQTTMTEAGESCLVTTLLHTSGQFIRGMYPLNPKALNNPQDVGSAVTYARRYAYAAIVGLTQEDDDGERVVQELRKAPVRTVQKHEDEGFLNQEQSATRLIIPSPEDQATEKQRTLISVLIKQGKAKSLSDDQWDSLTKHEASAIIHQAKDGEYV